MPEAVLLKLIKHFHAVIPAWAGKLVNEQDFSLPKLTNFRATKQEPAWLTAPGMYGVFKY